MHKSRTELITAHPEWVLHLYAIAATGCKAADSASLIDWNDVT